MVKRIIRDYRAMKSPTKFLNFCKRVVHALTENPNCIGAMEALFRQLCEKVSVLDKVYHEALDGSHTLKRERDRIAAEIVVLLDQIASQMESICVLNPDGLLTTGFTVTQERRNTPRVKLPLSSPTDFVVENLGPLGKALATGSTFPGALIREIHINVKDPSVEAYWSHKANFSDSQEMILEDLTPGNTFFRMRHFGHDGAGPWSAVVSTTIT